MRPSNRLIPLIALLIILIDGWFKSLALTHFPADSTLMDPGIFALAVHHNYGIAFNIPLKLPFILLVSLLLGAVLMHVVWVNRHKNTDLWAAALLTVIGGLGNIYDRIAYGFTVDYLLLFGRSAINLSDIVILCGIIWMLLASRPHLGEEILLTETKK